MNLIIDIGNSQTKVGIFDQGKIVQTLYISCFDQTQYAQLQTQYGSISKGILSSVTNYDIDFIEQLKGKLDLFVVFDAHTPIPIINHYESKSTLGLDRLAAAVGASTLFPNQELLVIDAGTAITYDLIDKNNIFLGGSISPGLAMRFKALNHFTAKLPEIKPAIQFSEFGKNTEEAIRSGVQQGIIFEIEGVIKQRLTTWPTCQVILTGGDAEFFEQKLKMPIFVKPELTLIGLDRILEYTKTN
ncbi:MAG: type III pantothenate kinase [Bacteroidia bacterium]|nr:type III pantothenate kinase [Bacteroidia bacterium]